MWKIRTTVLAEPREMTSVFAKSSCAEKTERCGRITSVKTARKVSHFRAPASDFGLLLRAHVEGFETGAGSSGCSPWFILPSLPSRTSSTVAFALRALLGLDAGTSGCSDGSTGEGLVESVLTLLEDFALGSALVLRLGRGSDFSGGVTSSFPRPLPFPLPLPLPLPFPGPLPLTPSSADSCLSPSCCLREST